MGSNETSESFEPAPDSGGLRVRTFQGSTEELALLSGALRRGELVALPTETVYGLAANALDPAACRRIFEVKGRPLLDPLIVHVARPELAEQLADVNDAARLLMLTYWPGPLTIVMPRKPNVPDIVTAGLPTVAIRCPRHPLAHALLEACGLPLSAPSANLFGYVSPTRPEHVIDGLGDRIDYLLDGGPCEVGLESTIVDVCDPRHPILLRPGGISREQLSETLGTEVVLHKDPVQKAAEAKAQKAPGMLMRHYSPRTSTALFPFGSTQAFARREGDPRIALVFFSRTNCDLNGGFGLGTENFWLSEDGDPAEAARNVFDLLRSLDRMGFGRILVEKAPEGGIGDAINDRLRRAAAQG